MRIVDEHLAQILLKTARSDLCAERIEYLLVAEAFSRIAAVYPVFESSLEEGESARIGTGILLAHQELAFIENSLDALAVKTFLRKLLEGFAHNAAAFRNLLLRCIPNGEHGGNLLYTLRTDFNILAESSVQKRLLKRGLVGSGKHLGYHGEGKLLLAFVKATNHPAIDEDILVLTFVRNLVPNGILVGGGFLKRNLGVHFGAAIVLKEGIEFC